LQLSVFFPKPDIHLLLIITVIYCAAIEDNGINLVMDLGGGNSITFTGIDSLDAGDFIF